MEPAGQFRQAPDRAALITHLHALLGPEVALVDEPVFHYLGQRVEAEVYLAPALIADPPHLAQLKTRVAEALKSDPWFSAVSLNCRIAP